MKADRSERSVWVHEGQALNSHFTPFSPLDNLPIPLALLCRFGRRAIAIIMTAPSPPPPPLDPPFRGYIETTFDALLVFEAARRGMIPRVTRRLIERERGMVQSGAVFVFDEHESGIKRWTDGLVWSPSRILGNFLVRSAAFSWSDQIRCTAKQINARWILQHRCPRATPRLSRLPDILQHRPRWVKQAPVAFLVPLNMPNHPRWV